ncbi:hypothetical protein EV127DRAFT_487910 [Xylaria flabelliformis]|nr:hypothetical protein EV127DRAFT_487910 [Xylaria flabelliformis]
MEYIAQLGAFINGRFSDDEDEFSSLISLAALNGHEKAMKWLLSKGAALDRSLRVAVMHGSFSIMQLLMEHRAIQDHNAVQRSPVEAIKTENEALFRLLVVYGMRPDQSTVEKATQIAETKQIDFTRDLGSVTRQSVIGCNFVSDLAALAMTLLGGLSLRISTAPFRGKQAQLYLSTAKL